MLPKPATWNPEVIMENEYDHDLLDLGNYPLPSCSALKGIFPAIEGLTVWALNKTQS